MTGLMTCVRRPTARRWTASIAAASFIVAIGGCAEDRAANSDSKRTPIAVTASGVEIMEVVKSENKRIVEAVIVAGGEERQVTFAPFLDGPLPFGFAATLSSVDGDALIQLKYGWDGSSGASWVQQQAGDDVLELTRTVVNGRVLEEYVVNGQSLALEYADLPPAVADKAFAKFLRGEPAISAVPEVVEFVAQLSKFDSFAANIPAGFLSEDANGQLLASLVNDPVFVGALVGDDVTPNNLVTALCHAFTQCAAVICRFSPLSVVCGVCASGVLACIFIELFCAGGACG